MQFKLVSNFTQTSVMGFKMWEAKNMKIIISLFKQIVICLKLINICSE